MHANAGDADAVFAHSAHDHTVHARAAPTQVMQVHVMHGYAVHPLTTCMQ
jgi:hypothetical protein